MWPAQVGTGKEYPPDCRTYGNHRWSQLRFLSRNKTNYIQNCRACGILRAGVIDITKGNVDVVQKYREPDPPKPFKYKGMKFTRADIRSMENLVRERGEK